MYDLPTYSPRYHIGKYRGAKQCVTVQHVRLYYDAISLWSQILYSNGPELPPLHFSLAVRKALCDLIVLTSASDVAAKQSRHDEAHSYPQLWKMTLFPCFRSRKSLPAVACFVFDLRHRNTACRCLIRVRVGPNVLHLQESPSAGRPDQDLWRPAVCHPVNCSQYLLFREHYDIVCRAIRKV